MKSRLNYDNDKERKRRLATWPRGGDWHAYARLLIDELHTRSRRIPIESTDLSYDLCHPDNRDPNASELGRMLGHAEAEAKVRVGSDLAATAIAYAPNPWWAKGEAELFALREVALAEPGVPVYVRRAPS